MGGPAFGYKNYVISGSVSASSSAAGMGPSQTQSEQGASATAWQTATGVVTGAIFNVDAGAMLPWDVVAVCRTNLTAGASVTIGFYDNSATLIHTESFSSLLTAGYGQMICVLSGTITARSIACTFADASNPDGFLNIPLVYAGPVWHPSHNVAPTSAEGRDDSTDEVVTRGGQEFPVVRWQRRRWSLAFQRITAAEVATVHDLDRVARYGGNVLFIPDTGATPAQAGIDSVLGRFRALADLTFPTPSADIRAWRAQITERL